jgi:hypothetical protein
MHRSRAIRYTISPLERHLTSIWTKTEAAPGYVKRGDIVTAALQEGYGKPRPAPIVQSNLLDA